MERLANKNVIITGASSGIGEAMAIRFAEEGANLILVGRNDKRGLGVVNQIEKMGGKATWYRLDVSNEQEVRKFKEYVEENYSELDCLVNNAGIWELFQLDEICRENIEKVFSVNTNSVMYMTQAFEGLLKKSGGNIINIASIGGLQSYIAGRTQYLYASAKAATIQFSQLCALNLAPEVRVNCLCPGPTDTPIYTNKDYSRFYDSIPMHRVGQAKEVANAALFLCSNEASYITGAVLTVDGGASLK